MQTKAILQAKLYFSNNGFHYTEIADGILSVRFEGDNYLIENGSDDEQFFRVHKILGYLDLEDKQKIINVAERLTHIRKFCKITIWKIEKSGVLVNFSIETSLDTSPDVKDFIRRQIEIIAQTEREFLHKINLPGPFDSDYE